MTDVIAVPMGRNGLPAVARVPFAVWAVGIGFAALAGATAGLAISASTARGALTAAPIPVHQASQTSIAVKRPPPPPGVPLEVAKVWAEESALIRAATNIDMRGVRADAWAPAGGLAMLAADPFQPVVNVAAAKPEEAPAAAAKSVPLPPPMPLARLNDTRRSVASRKPARLPQLASLPPQAPEPGYFDFFRKLFFGNRDHAARAMLAANPKAAIYDIADRVVYLPNGDKLEAHSGYGEWLDDPSSVARKDRGVTPPNIYTVSFREKLFHGVRALRLTPVGNGKMYGRDGMLAHSYMLGEDGQSNGCVSVKNYKKFLQAYEEGVFDHLIVLPRIDDSAPSRVASAQRGNV